MDSDANKMMQDVVRLTEGKTDVSVTDIMNHLDIEQGRFKPGTHPARVEYGRNAKRLLIARCLRQLGFCKYGERWRRRNADGTRPGWVIPCGTPERPCPSETHDDPRGCENTSCVRWVCACCRFSSGLPCAAKKGTPSWRDGYRCAATRDQS